MSDAFARCFASAQIQVKPRHWEDACTTGELYSDIGSLLSM